MASRTDSAFLERIRLAGNPVANPGSVVVRGEARFTLLTARLVRLEWSPGGVFEDRATFAFPNRASPPPRYTVQETGDTLLIDTGALQIRHRPGRGPFSGDNLSITLSMNGRPVTWRPGTPDPGNLRGTRRTLDNASAPVSLSAGLISRSGWALYDDSRNVLLTEGGAWVAPRPTHDLQDWYFFGYGHAYTDALQEYTLFGGPIPLIPRFVLGAWWSRYWPYSADDLKEIVAGFEEHGLPLDVLVIDMDWHTPHSWTGYTWNRELFPDPQGFLRWAHERGLHVTLNLHPAEGVQPFEEAYPEFATAMGVDPASEETVLFQPGNPAFVKNYFELLHHPMEDQGVDFWWIDWQQGDASDIPGLDPLLWLNHLHFLDSARRGKRPMLYSRWGGLGNHRYHIGFSGDTYAVWPALGFLPYFTATASNVLYGWWSHDIGGHFGADTPEMFARWVQFGAVSPCLRLHAARDVEAERRPWAFPRPVFEAARKAFEWRYEAIPYLYTMARVASETGVSLCRPLYYAYPEHEAAYLAPDQYFLGDSVMAAPIVQPVPDGTGPASVDVWIPPGTWIDYETHETFEGPRWVRLFGDLMRMPRFVPAGAILPLGHVAPTTSSMPRDRLTLLVFPGSSGSFRLYEDDGATVDYLRGEYEWTPVAMQADGRGKCSLRIGPAEGKCSALPGQRGYNVRFVASTRPTRILVDGEETGDWEYDAEARTAVVHVPPRDRYSGVIVELDAPRDLSVPPDAHNRECVLADLRRLLGPACPAAAWDDLPSAMLALDHPRRADAVARLGGPFVRVLEHTTLPEAGYRLGQLLIVAPRDGSQVDAAVTWTLHSCDGDRREVQELRGMRTDRVLDVPFAFDSEAQPLGWEVEVAIEWRGSRLLHRHVSRVLCPSVTAWRVALAGTREVLQLSGPEGAAALAARGVVYRQDPESMPSLADPFVVLPGEAPSGEQDGAAARAAYACTTVVSRGERTVRVVYDSPGDASCWLNGEQVVEEEPGTVTLPDRLPATREPRVSVPVPLQAGSNLLLLVVTPDEADGRMEFQASVREPNGQVATGLRFMTPDAEH